MDVQAMLDGRTSDARRLHHAGADPPPRAEGYRLVRLCRPEPAAAVQEPRRLPLLGLVPVLLVHVARVHVDDHLGIARMLAN